MAISQKSNGKAKGIGQGMAHGILASSGITLLGTWIVACVIDREILSWQEAGYGLILILLLASFGAGVTVLNKTQKTKVSVCMLSGLLYWAELMSITALFFGGRYSGVGETAAVIFCGSILAAMTGKRRMKHKLVPRYNR